MVSGIPTSSGYEERIRFSEMEVVDRGANEQGLLVNMPEGNIINGWDVNIASVRTTSVRRTLRYHQHAVCVTIIFFFFGPCTLVTAPFLIGRVQEFLIRVRQQDGPSIYIGRRFGDFARLHKKLRTELPGKIIPPLPRKNKTSVSSSFIGSNLDDDASSTSSVNTLETTEGQSTRNLVVPGTLKHKTSMSSLKSIGSQSPRASGELQGETVTLYREEQRVSLRAFLRLILQNHRIASSNAIKEFLTDKPITLNEEEEVDVARRKELDAKRIEEQRRFYEIARKRARELDVYMEQFRQDIVERSK